ncbi:MAG: O-antigen ligase family protein [Coriobacteriia bacterium]|nr:O-antigen ligase family protein [Coriobacteriia bacterium]
MPEPVTRPESTRSAALPKPLLWAWVLLAALFAFALSAHEWAGYEVGLAAFALAAVVLCFLDERASVVLFIGCSALDAYGFITHVPFSLSVARVTVVAVVAGAAVRWPLSKPRPRLDLRALSLWDIGVLMFLAGAALSVPLTYSMPLSLVGILHLAFLVGAYFLLSRAARAEEGRADIYDATIAAGTLSALVALGQTFVTGFPLEVLRATESVADATSAVRASAFFDNPNTMALLLVLSTLFAIERVWTTRRPAMRWAYIAAAVLALAGIGVSYSRAALVGIVFGGLALGMLLIRHGRGRLAFAAVLALVLALMLAIPGVDTRAESIVDFQSDASAMDRVYLAQVSLEMFADRPLTGVGIQAFREAYPDYEDSRVTIDPVTDGHQMPLSVPAEVGVLGLIAEVMLFGGLLYLLVQSLRAGHEPLAPAGLAAMAAITVMTLFNTFVFFESMWIAAALVGEESKSARN